MTRGDFLRHCSQELGLDNTAAGKENLLMIDWLNEGVRDVLLETHCVIRKQTINLTAGQGDYTLTSPSVLAVLDLQLISAVDSQLWKLARVQVQEILDMRLSSAIANDAPRFYALEGDTLMVYPAPSTNDTITVYVVNKPTEMTSDAHDPSVAPYGEVPIYAHHAILLYMLWRGARYEDKGGGFWRGHAFSPGIAYKDLYEEECKEIRKWLRNIGGRRLSPARVGYPGRNRIAHRNDTYPQR